MWKSLTPRWALVALAAAMLLVTTSERTAKAEEPIKIGVLAKRGTEKCLKKWAPTAEYLSQKLGKTFRIQPLKFDAVPVFLKQKKVDFFLVNSNIPPCYFR